MEGRKTPKIFRFCTLNLRQNPKTPKIVQSYNDPPKKYPQFLHTPQNINFSENPEKNIEMQNFDPKKMIRA